MLHRLEPGCVILPRLNIEPLRRIEPKLLREFLIPIDQVIERGVGDLGGPGSIRRLMIPNLLRELPQLDFPRTCSPIPKPCQN